MHVTDILKNRQKTLISLEITPPEKGHSVDEIFQAVDQLITYHPSFINVTYHQQHIVYEEVEGKIVKVPRRKKPGTIGICAALVNRYKIETVPHLICGGFSKYETEDALIDLHYLGFDNLFALRGDPPIGIKEFVPEPDGHCHATELVEQITNLNQGKYLENLEGALPTNFCVGVAGYPEKHHEAPNLTEDIKYLKEKIDKGAQYIITQMLFSAEAYRQYVEAVRSAGITVPIIPGIKVLTNPRQLVIVPRDFHLSLPEDLVHIINQANGPIAAREAGIAYTVKFCNELIKSGAHCLHFYTMGKGTLVAEVLNRLKQKTLI